MENTKYNDIFKITDVWLDLYLLKHITKHWWTYGEMLFCIGRSLLKWKQCGRNELSGIWIENRRDDYKGQPPV